MYVLMDSEKNPGDSTGYFSTNNPENMFMPNTNQFLPNPGFINTHPFVSPVSVPNVLHYQYPNMIDNSEPFKNFQIPIDRSNPFNSSRFKWTESTKPEYAFTLNSPPPAFLNAGSYGNLSSGCFGHKRKTKSPSPARRKQHITEERMAEHMSQLYISSKTQVSPQETEPVRERRLYMCDEMQRLQTESIIPIEILERVQRPCTALIPWNPPMVPLLDRENNNVEDILDASEQLQTDIMDTGL